MSKRAAFLIVQALNIFKNEPPQIRQQAQQIIMQRVNRMMNGDNSIIEGEGLVTVIPEANETTPGNTTKAT